MLENHLHAGDARQLPEYVDPESVDAIITSPPYADLKDYGADGQIGFGQDYRTEYLPQLEDIFKKCYQAAKSTCSLWVVVDTLKRRKELVPLPFDLAAGICKAGWRFRDVIVWDKGKTLPWSRKGQVRNVFEYILFFTKSDDYKYRLERITDPEPQNLKQWWVKYPERYNPAGKVPSNIWEFTIPTQGSWGRSAIRHFCPFPSELVERMLLISTDEGDMVLDPFAGSGSVLAQAAAMRRRYVGIELNQTFKSQFSKVAVEIAVAHAAREKERAVRRRDQERFQDLIWRLRTLKYPVQLLRRMDTSATGAVSSVIMVSSTPAPHSHEATLVLVVKDELAIDAVLAEARSRASRAPLSKYGLDVTIQVVTEARAIETAESTLGGGERWLYRAGRFWTFHSTWSPAEGLPVRTKPGEAAPMISNVRVRQTSAEKFDEDSEAASGTATEAAASLDTDQR
jgi:DNA modification methylase